MKSIHIYFLFVLFFLAITSCSDNSADTLGEVTFEAYQVGGCCGNSLAKAAYLDSCFSYSFDDILEIDFCLSGNCCPDSNRFITDYTISSDTIYIIATDIEENLCKCICPYQIHLEFTNLEYDKYVFRCDYYDSFSYREEINRGHCRN